MVVDVGDFSVLCNSSDLREIKGVVRAVRADVRDYEAFSVIGDPPKVVHEVVIVREYDLSTCGCDRHGPRTEAIDVLSMRNAVRLQGRGRAKVAHLMASSHPQRNYSGRPATR